MLPSLVNATIRELVVELNRIEQAIGDVAAFVAPAADDASPPVNPRLLGLIDQEYAVVTELDARRHASVALNPLQSW